MHRSVIAIQISAIQPATGLMPALVGSTEVSGFAKMKELTIGGYVSVRDGRHVIHRKLPSAW